MSQVPLHPWNVDPKEAVRLQESLRERLALKWDGREVRTVGGVDVSYRGGRAFAVIVVMRFPEMVPVAQGTAAVPLSFPYIPGLFAFREGPAALAAWEALALKPDLLLFDGQGSAHPRGFGLAAHMGLWLEVPAVGAAKTRLYGVHGEVGPKAGDWAPLRDERDPERIIGAALRTRAGTKPLYVSPGHRVDLERAVDFVLSCCRGFRIPEPLRLAHRLCTDSAKA